MEILDFNSPELQDLFHSLEQIDDQISQLILDLAKKQWLTPNEVCKEIGISRRTLQRYRDHYNLPHVKIDGKVFFDRTTLEKFLRERQ